MKAMFKSFFQKYIHITSSNRIYLALFAILVGVFIYNYQVVLFEDGVERTRVNAVRNEIDPDLSRKKPEKIYKDVMLSAKGDRYRLGFVAQAERDEAITVFVISPFGTEKEVGKILLKKDERKYQELVFTTDDDYQDIILRKSVTSLPKYRDLEEEAIRLSGFSLSRLSSEEEELKSTFYGNEEIKNISPNILGNFDSESLRNSNNSLNVVFQNQGDYISDINFNIHFVGTGGKGNYKFSLFQYDPEDKKVGHLVSESSFSSQNIRKYLQKDGSYKLPMSAFLQVGSWYQISLSNSQVEVNENNYLSLPGISNSLNIEKNYFLFSLGKFPQYNETGRFLLDSKIEDQGDELLYSYSTLQKRSDYFNLYEFSGDVQYDEKNNWVEAVTEEGTSFTYAVNTGRPFRELKIEAKQRGSVKKELNIEYSSDNKQWSSIPFIQKDGDSQYFRQVIKGESEQIRIYIRVSCDSTSNNEGKKFGLDFLKVQAVLLK